MDSVLITGGTGSFGNAYVEHLIKKKVRRIVIFSRDEVKQAEMREKFPQDCMRFFIGDVRDQERLRRAFEGVDTVIHAAALKRIEVGHYNPEEMVKTNVLGAMNVIEAARQMRVRKVVALSTDKACEPISTYGQTKALAESLFSQASVNSGGYGPKFSITRYGNVAFSRGSVIPKWKKQIANGETINLTDPDATRFYMTIDQAVDLVHETAANMPKGVVIPQLAAYRLEDLAFAIGAPAYNVIGLPVWEKKHESMIAGQTSENARRLSIQELKSLVA